MIGAFIARRANLQLKFFGFNSLMLLLVFGTLSAAIYFTQKERIGADANAQMQTHLSALEKLLEVSYVERQAVLSQATRAIEDLTQGADGLVVSDSTAQVQARWNRTEDYEAVDVPLWYWGGKPVQTGQDEITELVANFIGGNATIFQRLNDEALYYVASTNVLRENGEKSKNIITEVNNTTGYFAKIEAGERVANRLEVNGEWTTALWMPLFIDGTVQGAWYLGIPEKNIGLIKDQLAALRYYQTGYPYLIDSKGSYVVHPTHTGEQPDYLDLAHMQENKRGTLRYQTPDGIWKLGYFAYFEPFDLFAVVAAPEYELLHKPINSIRNVVMMGFVIALIISLAGIFLLVRNLTQPINRLNRRLKDLAMGKHVAITGTDRTDEIGEIAHSVDRVVQGLNQASAYAHEVGKGNFQAAFTPLSDEDVMGNALLRMKDNLQEAAQEEQWRNWANTGMAEFSQILRDHSSDLQTLAEHVLRKTVKYLNANQGAFFVVESLHQNDAEQCLRLKACYAWDRKKYVDKVIMPGEGLAGQAWLEQEAIYLEQVPEAYVEIQSGLGGAAPAMVFILPLKLNNAVYGVMEIASFEPLNEFERTFLVRIAESIASTLSMAKTNEQTRTLLSQTQEMTQMLRAQEEEMRQNVEELETTQEEMRRREEVIKKKLNSLQTENQQLMESLGKYVSAKDGGE